MDDINPRVFGIPVNYFEQYPFNSSCFNFVSFLSFWHLNVIQGYAANYDLFILFVIFQYIELYFCNINSNHILHLG